MTAVTKPPRYLAAYSDEILAELRILIPKWMPSNGGVALDPMCGSGRIHELAGYALNTYGIELEQYLVDMYPHERTRQGDARNLPYPEGSFDGIVVSPVYGNRFSDSFHSKDPEKWDYKTYSHFKRKALGDHSVDLESGNAGCTYLGQKTNGEYEKLHRDAWREAARVLTQQGVWFLNTSDFLETRRQTKTRPKEQVQVEVTNWHVQSVERLRFEVVDYSRVKTKRSRHGANGDVRVEYEDITVLGRLP